MENQQQTAIVTGGTMGIGLAIVHKLRADGYYVIFTARNEQTGKEIEAALNNKNCEFFRCDIGEEPDVKKLFERVNSSGKPLWVVVNNAGILADSMIWKMSTDDFDKVIRTNLRGTWLMCREAAAIMKEKKSGRIINISSRAWLGLPGQTNYAGSKGGVNGMTRSLALEMGRYGVTVNGVAPGLINTPMIAKLPQEVQQKLIEAQPTRTMGKPEDVAEMVSFLASGKSQFITGQLIYVDGGKSIGAGV
ncbi:MAG: SDR family oxidoreductase [Bacteroidetes bacterium]|nr:SDR family oxidoreductase [Bacteroidota bacterium]